MGGEMTDTIRKKHEADKKKILPSHYLTAYVRLTVSDVDALFAALDEANKTIAAVQYQALQIAGQRDEAKGELERITNILQAIIVASRGGRP